MLLSSPPASAVDSISISPAVTQRCVAVENPASVHPARRGRDLLRNCPLLADGFDDLDDLIADYVDSTAGIVGAKDELDDALAFLEWMDERLFLTAEEQDFVNSQRGLHGVEIIAVQQRVAHLRFQQLAAQSEGMVADVSRLSRRIVTLNPVRVWSSLQTRALLNDQTELPATVLFVPRGMQVNRVVVGELGNSLLRLLESSGPLTVTQLMRLRSTWSSAQIVAELKTLASQGAIALR